jgi:[citrate (pro-3S)-lyase] ligase
MFRELFFYPVAQTDQVLLMEDRPDGIGTFLRSLPAPEIQGVVGAAVMYCNPFTLGHRYLIETAAEACDRLYVFVLSQEQPPFPARDRLELVRRGVADLPNVTVLPTGPYLLSAATFPTYFLPDRETAGAIRCGLDVEIFTKYYAPHFGITHRFVGTEPLSTMTDAYNAILKAQLPERGIAVTELPRLEKDGQPISASHVRSLLGQGQPDALRSLLPLTTFDYLQKNNLI